MSLINTKIKPFKNQAFKNGEFIEVTEKDTEGAGASSSSIRLTSPSFARPNWVTWLTITTNCRSWA
jgi:hypothetical protein